MHFCGPWCAISVSSQMRLQRAVGSVEGTSMLLCRASVVVAEAEAGEVVAAGARSEASAPGATLLPWTLMLVLCHVGRSCYGHCYLDLTVLAIAF